MKTKIITLASITFLFITSGNIFAGTGEKINSQEVNTSINECVSNFEVMEAELEMEGWMTSFKEFDRNIELNFESELDFESWMLRGITLGGHENGTPDQDLTYEPWMLSPFQTVEVAVFMDKELDFETWMLRM